MICHHNIETPDGCKLCWKERAEKAEAACGEMRTAVHYIMFDHPGRNAIPLSVFDYLHDHVLSTSCGQGWLSPDKVKALEFTLNTQADIIKMLESDKAMLLDRIQKLQADNEELGEHNAALGVQHMNHCAKVEALIEALEPFAACEVESFGSVPDSQAYLWKPSASNRELSGISIADIKRAKRILAAAKGEQP